MILACGKWSSRLSAVYKKATVNVYRLTVEFENPARPNRTTFLGVNTQQHFFKNQKKKKYFFSSSFRLGFLFRIGRGERPPLWVFRSSSRPTKKSIELICSQSPLFSDLFVFVLTQRNFVFSFLVVSSFVGVEISRHFSCVLFRRVGQKTYDKISLLVQQQQHNGTTTIASRDL